MKKENSAGIIVFKKIKNDIHYLILHYESGHWDFPKGHIEKGEDEIEAARRELKEETGIEDIELLKKFKESIFYFFRDEKKNLIRKEVIFFLAKTEEKKVRLSFEHKGFIWLPFKNAYEMITHKNAKGLLQKADRFLAKNYHFSI